MATDRQHNEIVKAVFKGNKHLKHVLLNSDEISKLTMIEGRFPLTKLPVCSRCEKLGLWDHDVLTGEIVGHCKACGTITRNAVTYSTYLAKELDIDKTGDSFRRMLVVDKKYDQYKRLVYLPDFSRLEGKK
jgi:hypothetical protein